MVRGNPAVQRHSQQREMKQVCEMLSENILKHTMLPVLRRREILIAGF